MSLSYNVEYTDTFGGDANYTWVRRAKLTVPELTHYGYDGSSNYVKANKIAMRELMKAAKAAMNITGSRGRVERYGDEIIFYPYKSCTVMFISYNDFEEGD
jgi:hypothetical protein